MRRMSRESSAGLTACGSAARSGFLANLRGLLVFVRSAGILLKDFADWAMDLTEEICRSTERRAHDLERKLVYLESCHTNKEETALEIARLQGITEGLVCILSCVEPGTSFKVGPNKELKQVELRQFWGRCLHYYFYILPSHGITTSLKMLVLGNRGSL